MSKHATLSVIKERVIKGIAVLSQTPRELRSLFVEHKVCIQPTNSTTSTLKLSSSSTHSSVAVHIAEAASTWPCHWELYAILLE